jgi:uncharacterized membrane protein
MNLALVTLGGGLAATVVLRAISRRQNKSVWLTSAILAGIVGVAVFFLTEDMSKLMVLVDQRTIVGGAIFAAESVASVFSLRRK